MLLPNHHPSLRMQYDEALALLRAEWVPGGPPQQYQAALIQLLRAAQVRTVRHCFLDMPDMPDISVYDQVWLGANWMPAIVKLPLERVVLAIHRRRVHNQLAIDSLLAMFRGFIRFDIQYFPQPQPGMQWLSDHSERLPALLAKWEAVYGPLDLQNSARPAIPLS